MSACAICEVGEDDIAPCIGFIHERTAKSKPARSDLEFGGGSIFYVWAWSDGSAAFVEIDRPTDLVLLFVGLDAGEELPPDMAVPPATLTWLRVTIEALRAKAVAS